MSYDIRIYRPIYESNYTSNVYKIYDEAWKVIKEDFTVSDWREGIQDSFYSVVQ